MKKKTTPKRDYVARLVVYGFTKEVKPKTLVKWLRTQADNLEEKPKEYSEIMYVARLMK